MSYSPAITYVVSAYDRPDRLPCVLWSLRAQSDPNFEVIVADNSPDPATQNTQALIVASLNDARFRHIDTYRYSTSPAWDCYWSAEWIVENAAQGEFICLPSDDSYYVPLFQEAMLASARANNWQLVYCDMLYDRRGHGAYHHKVSAARVCEIDKTNWILARSAWIGFPTKPMDRPRACCADGEMIVILTQEHGVSHGRCAEILCVHN